MDFQILLRAFIQMFGSIREHGNCSNVHRFDPGNIDSEKKELVFNATLAALVICVFFLLVGYALLYFPGITAEDFRIAGGLNSACNFNNRFIILCVGSPDVRVQ